MEGPAPTQKSQGTAVQIPALEPPSVAARYATEGSTHMESTSHQEVELHMLL